MNGPVLEQAYNYNSYIANSITGARYSCRKVSVRASTTAFRLLLEWYASLV